MKFIRRFPQFIRVFAFVCAFAFAFAAASAAAQTAGAPVIGAAAAGDTQAFVFFSAPASTGGSPIASYTATCRPNPGIGSVTGSSATAPIAVTGLVNGTAYDCSVTANNASGSGAASATASVTPSASAPLTLLGVKSRK